MTSLAPSTNLVAHTPSQDGSFIAAGWDEGADGIILATAPQPAPSVIGLTYTWNLRFDGLYPLDPPIISDFTLVLTGHPTMAVDPGADIVEVYAVPQETPADFSFSIPPFSRGGILIGAGTFSWSGVGTTVTISAGVYRTGTDPQTPTCADNWATIRALYLSSTRWNGKLCLSLQNVVAGQALTFNSNESAGGGPVLSSIETNFFAGLAGGPTGPRQRFVRDQRFGMPALNTELVQDGVVGMWVRPEDADPEDLPATYRPKPGEGSVDDEVPNL